jgi:hypothetical protein
VDSGSNRVSHAFNMTENSELSTPKTRAPFLGPSAVGALVRVLNRGPFHGGAMAWTTRLGSQQSCRRVIGGRLNLGSENS